MKFRDEPTLSLPDYIIAFLLSARSHRIRKQILWEILQEKREFSRKHFYLTNYRLAQKGMIKVEKDFLELADLQRVQNYYSNRFIKSSPSKEKQIIIIFDIPEAKRKTRNWLRSQLKYWQFEMIQKSVWKGNGPLPKEFGERLILLGIKDDVKIFTIYKNK